MVGILWLDKFMFYLCFDMIMEWSCFCLTPSRSQSGTLRYRCSTKSLMCNRRIPWPSCEGQASSQNDKGLGPLRSSQLPVVSNYLSLSQLTVVSQETVSGVQNL